MNHQRRIATLVIAGLLLVCPAASEAEPAADPPKPNIILVFIDDMGWADFSCFGNKDAATPHIDALAVEGIAFEQFYVNSPVCSPSRVSISTGTYPQRWLIKSYLASRGKNKAFGMANWLDPKAPMLARSLKEAGYATGHFGKWHMGGQRDVTDAPAITEYGFDASLTNFEGLGAKLLPMTKTPDGKIGKIWQDAQRLGGPVTWMQRSEITAGFVDASIKFIKKARQEGKPFYINVWPDDVHSPFWPLVEKWGDGSKRDKYLGVLEGMDAQLGTLFKTIKDDESLRENTLILICSDNGPEPGAGQATPFRGVKWQLYEGGIRSPLIVWGPGLMDQTAMGSRNKKSVFSAMDLVPSLMALIGATTPTGAEYDGEDVSGALLGKEDNSRKEPIFFERPAGFKKMPMPGFEDQLPDLAVRSGKWKLLCDYDGNRPQLYDLDTDPGETNNLTEKHADKTRQLVREVTAWHRDVSAGAAPEALD
ncbi:MAG: sulfatase-like hydrolase/transferase [Akkermansiaceae bacterium]